MRTTETLIVGGGLSGLYAAHLLQQQGKDYRLLESRTGWGGRIASATVSGGIHNHRFDLGPTWFWPDFQTQLAQRIDELGLEVFAQHEAGDTVIERSLDGLPARVRGYPSSPVSMRVVGGMTALVDAIRQGCDPQRLIMGQAVRRLVQAGTQVEVHAQDGHGEPSVYRADRVVLAIPPRLAIHRIHFTPELPPGLLQAWRNTPTWMAPHSKYLAVYDTPFWREQGLSGQARSAVGPMVEIHDASAPGGPAALFGFLGLSAPHRSRMSEETLKAHCRAQLERLFGHQAGQPSHEFLKDWAQDPDTATPADANAAGHHSTAPPSHPAEGPWAHRIWGVASEWSPQFSGYVAGAIEAATLGVQALGVTSEAAR